ncbi:MAG TPA: enoyl-CoA hydratase-related protein [Polyangiaceae bacterium]|nr:enoyl-CoA hydratase-related protein [Polyangiaceae bacterium]
MPTDAAPLHVEIADGIALLTLNRPEKLNALSDEMIEAAIAVLERCATDPDVGCVVVTGEGRAFSAGGDVSGMGARARAEPTYEQRVDRQRSIHRWPLLLHELPKVTIAAVNGVAAGAGLGLALSCDLRIASDRARFTTAFAKVGFGGDFGTTWMLARLVGEAKAKELFFLSEVIGADEALRLGLVNRVAPHDALLDEVRRVARRIASGPLVSFRYMKENVHLAATSSYGAMLDREALTHLRCGQTEDHREGVAAFLEKREPRFRGR